MKQRTKEDREYEEEEEKENKDNQITKKASSNDKITTEMINERKWNGIMLEHAKLRCQEENKLKKTIEEDNKNCKNYRGITLLNTLEKVLEKYIEQRLRQKIEQEGQQQNPE